MLPFKHCSTAPVGAATNRFHLSLRTNMIKECKYTKKNLVVLWNDYKSYIILCK